MQLFCYFDDRGQRIGGNLPKNCEICVHSCDQDSQIITCEVSKAKRRRGVSENVKGKTYFCSGLPDDLASSKIFRRQLEQRADLLEMVVQLKDNIEEKTERRMHRQIHNLTTLNAQCIQEIYSFISQDALAETQQDAQIRVIRETITKDSSGSAQLFARILKNNLLMKSEFSVFAKLYDTNPRIQKRDHVVHKVVLNVFHVFFSDFTEKEVAVDVEPSSEVVNFDYESVTVALIHIISNSVKYTLPKSRLRVSFERAPQQFRIVFDMRSLGVDPEEAETIFDEGFSGKRAKALGTSGSGMGLHIAKRLVELNGGTVFARLGAAAAYYLEKGIPYPENQFVISLPTK